MEGAGYEVGQLPENGDALIARLAAGPTNAAVSGRNITETYGRADYDVFFAALPAELRAAVMDRWGSPEKGI